jgi:hypothetical protein
MGRIRICATKHEVKKMQITNEVRNACKILQVQILNDEDDEGEIGMPIRITSPSDDREFVELDEFETYLAELLKPNVEDWTPDRNAEMLLEALELIGMLSGDVYDSIDLTNLNSAEFPERVSSYPVWAVDNYGRALVGSTSRQIEDIADVIEYYENKG